MAARSLVALTTVGSLLATVYLSSSVLMILAPVIARKLLSWVGKPLAGRVLMPTLGLVPPVRLLVSVSSDAFVAAAPLKVTVNRPELGLVTVTWPVPTLDRAASAFWMSVAVALKFRSVVVLPLKVSLNVPPV